MWADVEARLLTEGWRTRVVAAVRSADLRGCVDGVLMSTEDVPAAFREELRRSTGIESDQEPVTARSIVVGAVRRPATQAVLYVRGARRTFVVPPHYAGYHEGGDRFRRVLRDALAPLGFDVFGLRVPLKALAAHAGLARYGRTNTPLP